MASATSTRGVLNMSTKNVEYRCCSCFKTSKKKMKKCSRCHCAYYCSPECQAEDWHERHKKECVPKDKKDVPKQKASALVVQEFQERCQRYMQAFHMSSATTDQKEKALCFLSAAAVHVSDASRRLVMGKDELDRQTLAMTKEDAEITYDLVSAAFEMVGLKPPVRLSNTD